MVKRNSAAFLLMSLFALSGFAGLIYESIWTQYLGLFLGHAAYAQSFVLILFMGGMALGAWLISGRSERLPRPLAVYALIELVVGLLGVSFDPIYRFLTGLAYNHWFPSMGVGLGVEAVRYAVAALLIGPQCVLLGTTFPLMSAGYLRLMPSRGGRVLSELYFSNSLGGALGALSATFMLVPTVGLPGTIMAGGLFSVFVAITIWPLARGSLSTAAAASNNDADLVAPVFVLFAAALTGATSFVYEITWIRMLALALGSTLHAFELMLAAFILGIAFGGLWLRRRADAWPRTLFVAGWVQILMGVAALGSLFVYARTFDWVASLLAGLARSEQGYVYYNFATGMVALGVMFPAAFFAGMTLPLLTLTLMRRGLGERAIGRVYAANTIGAIAGILLTVHVLMPLLGVRIALWFAALADLALGVALIYRGEISSSRVRLRDSAGVAVLASIIAGITSLAFTRVDPQVLASSVYRVGEARLPADTRMLFYGDGKTATVAMYEFGGNNPRRSIATNGKVDASIAMTDRNAPSSDEYTMQLMAALPLAMHRSPRNVAIIGFGSGMTAHAFMGDERIRRQDVIEIEPFMIDAAKNFGRRVERAYSDTRSHVVFDDAKAFLSGIDRRYDVIVSEPSNPWVNGVASLFTREFYDFVPRHLSEGGIFVQWLQLYEIDPTLVASVLKAMLPRFADVRVYMANQTDMLLVASVDRPLPAPGDIQTIAPRLASELTRIGIESIDDFGMHYLMDRRGLIALAEMSDIAANSDYFPVLQLQAPRARFVSANSVSIANLQIAPWPLLEVAAGYQPEPVSKPSGAVVSSVPRDVMRRAAIALRAALMSGSPIASSLSESRELAMYSTFVRSHALACDIDEVADAWLEASSQAAALTIPFLSPNDLRGVWLDPVWMSVCNPADARVRNGMTLFAAVAARDWSSVAETGRKLLAMDGLSAVPGFRSYVLGVVELASLALHDRDGLVSAEKTYGANIREHAFERQWMMVLAYVAAESKAASLVITPK